MRIVAGSARGRTLAAPKGADVIRPTSDRARETLFNVLGQWCEGLVVLDLFAGTGALGLEALSRGAAFCVFVDRGREALALCRKNVDALGFTAQAELVASPVEKVWAPLGAATRRFDLVFADPPYALEAGRAVLEGVAPLLAPAARVVIESGKGEALPEVLGALALIDERSLGDTRLRTYQLR